MKKKIRTIKTILKWPLSLGVLYILLPRLLGLNPGTTISACMVVIIIKIYWYPIKYGETENPAEWEKKLHTNPLFNPGIFIKEKRQELSLSNIKCFFWCQVHAAVQMAVLVLYGIVSIIVRTQHLWFMHFDGMIFVLMIWTVAGMFIYGGLDEFFRWHQNRSCKGILCKPFSYYHMSRRLADRFVCECSDFAEMSSLIQRKSRGQNYELWNKYGWDGDKSIDTYIRQYEDDVALDVLEVIRVREFKQKHVQQLNGHFQNIVKEYFGTQRIDAPLQLTFLLCVDHITVPFRRLINTQFFVPGDMMVLPVGVSFKDKKIYIPTPYTDTFEYFFFRDTILDMLYY